MFSVGIEVGSYLLPALSSYQSNVFWISLFRLRSQVSVLLLSLESNWLLCLAAFGIFSLSLIFSFTVMYLGVIFLALLEPMTYCLSMFFFKKCLSSIASASPSFLFFLLPGFFFLDFKYLLHWLFHHDLYVSYVLLCIFNSVVVFFSCFSVGYFILIYLCCCSGDSE